VGLQELQRAFADGAVGEERLRAYAGVEVEQ
jgi:hypothetical protein